MAKYIRCPYCNHKNLAENGICSNCNRLLDSQIYKTPEPKKKRDYRFLFSLIRLFIFFFIVISLASYYLDKHPDILKRTIKDNYKEESFIKKMDSIIYDPNYIDNKLIPVKDYTSEEPFKLINKNGQVIIDNIVSYVGDYNSFHVITKRSNNNIYYYIVNNVGEELYKTKDKIYYYPATNSWVLGDKLYYNNKLIKDNIRIEDNNYSGYYFAFVDDKEQGIIDYEGNISYKSKTNKYNHFVLETTNILSLEQDNYCLINDNYNYLVVNCNTGKVIIDSKTTKLHEILPSIYYANNTIYYINNNKEVKEFNIESSIDELNVEYLDDNKILIDKFVYDNVTNEKININDIDLHSLSNKNIESLLNIQKEYCLNINKVKYGLKYKDEEIIPCENDSIIYFNNSIMQSLLADQKIYILINNGKKNSLYDVINNRILIDSVIAYSPYSIFIKYKEDNKQYIYNIISNEKIETPDNTSLELHSNYFMIEKYSDKTTSTNREYYNYDFKNIYLGN